MPFLLIGILGLVVGSFLNVVINRLNLGKSFVSGRSHCPYCHHELSVWDLFPVVSFFFLGGKCRYCGAPISWQYPLVELVTAVVFVLAWAKIGMLGIDLFFTLAMCCFFIVVAVYDYKHYLILDKVIFPGLAIAIIYALIRDFTSGDNNFNHIIEGVVGAAIISIFFYVQHLLSKGKWIGLGDVKFGLFLGMVLGIWPSVFLLFISYMSGAIVGIALIALGKKKLSSKLPFGVFLALCAIIILLVGEPLLDWYLKIILIR